MAIHKFMPIEDRTAAGKTGRILESAFFASSSSHIKHQLKTDKNAELPPVLCLPSSCANINIMPVRKIIKR